MLYKKDFKQANETKPHFTDFHVISRWSHPQFATLCEDAIKLSCINTWPTIVMGLLFMTEESFWYTFLRIQTLCYIFFDSYEFEHIWCVLNSVSSAMEQQETKKE